MPRHGSPCAGQQRERNSLPPACLHARPQRFDRHSRHRQLTHLSRALTLAGRKKQQNRTQTLGLPSQQLQAQTTKAATQRGRQGKGKAVPVKEGNAFKVKAEAGCGLACLQLSRCAGAGVPAAVPWRCPMPVSPCAREHVHAERGCVWQKGEESAGTRLTGRRAATGGVVHRYATACQAHQEGLLQPQAPRAPRLVQRAGISVCPASAYHPSVPPPSPSLPPSAETRGQRCTDTCALPTRDAKHVPAPYMTLVHARMGAACMPAPGPDSRTASRAGSRAHPRTPSSSTERGLERQVPKGEKGSMSLGLSGASSGLLADMSRCISHVSLHIS